MPAQRIPKREEELRAELMVELRTALPQFVFFRHEDIRASGIPDIEGNGHGVTTHWETKHGTPDFASPGIQELTNQRLARQSHSRYIIWQQGWHPGDPEIMRVMIVHPDEVKKRQSFTTIVAEHEVLGKGLFWLVARIAAAHNVRLHP
jgi:hypothetical protein